MCNFIHKLCFFFFRVIVDVDEGALLVIGFGGVGNGGEDPNFPRSLAQPYQPYQPPGNLGERPRVGLPRVCAAKQGIVFRVLSLEPGI